MTASTEILDLRVPVVEGLHSEAALWHELLQLGPRLLTYFLSFLTLGIFWVGQQTQLNQLARSNRDLTWIQLGFLLGALLLASLRYAERAGLLNAHGTPEMRAASRRRIVVYQALHALGCCSGSSPPTRASPSSCSSSSTRPSHPGSACSTASDRRPPTAVGSLGQTGLFHHQRALRERA